MTTKITLLKEILKNYISDHLEKKFVLVISEYEKNIKEIFEEIHFYGKIKIYLLNLNYLNENFEYNNEYNNDEFNKYEYIIIKNIEEIKEKVDFWVYENIDNFNKIISIVKNGSTIIGYKDEFNHIIEKYKDIFRISNINLFTVIKIIKPIKYHIYAIGWNESKMLKHLFKYYHDADKIIIVDNCSTDDTFKIVREYGKSFLPFNTDEFFDLIKIRNLKNNVWKQSKDVDFVIIHSINEFLFFPNFPNNIKLALEELKLKKVTILKSSVRNIYCDNNIFDNINDDQYITTSLFDSIIKNNTSKVICFSPQDIDEINYSTDSNNFEPKGNILIEENSILLKYKYISIDYYINRFKLISERFSPINKKLNIKSIYLQDINIIKLELELENKFNIFNEMYNNSIAKLSVNNKNCIIDTLGYDDITSKKILNGEIWSQNIYNWFINNINSETIYIDIGSHIGVYIAYAKMMNANKIYGFESSKVLFDKIQSTINLNGWSNIVICDTPLSKKNDEIIINTCELRHIDTVFETRKGSSNFQETKNIRKTSSLDIILTPSILSLPISLLSPIFNSKLRNESNNFESNNILEQTFFDSGNPTPTFLNSETNSLEESIINLEKNLFIPISKFENNEKIVIKLSVEGHEYEALYGMKKFLNSYNNIHLLIDLNYSKLFSDKINAILNLLVELKYIDATLINKLDCYDEEEIFEEDQANLDERIENSDEFYLTISNDLYHEIYNIGDKININSIMQITQQEYKLTILFKK